MSPDVTSFLREHYATQGSTWCAERLGLTWRQVQRRTHALGLRQRQLWTLADDDRLRFHWGAQSCVEIGKAMGRTPKAVYWRAKQLQLGLGCPRGFAYLSHVARDAGYEVPAMRRILKWAGVALGRGPTNPTSKKRGQGQRKHVTHIVDQVLALEAIDLWHAAEYLEEASRRVGLCAETIANLLITDGRVGPRPPGKFRWRIAVALINEVIAAYLDGETLAQAARRRGLRAETLRQRMIGTGLWTPGMRRGTRFPVAEIERALAEAA